MLICDDHRVLTDALAMVISHDPGMELAIPPVYEPTQAIDAVVQAEPDVVLMDVVFRGSEMNGIEACRRIRDLSPATKVIIMTAHEEDPLLVEAVEAGAAGFLAKSGAVDSVLDAVRAAAEGESLIDERTLSRLMHKVRRDRRRARHAAALLEQLTDREQEVLRLLVAGMRNEDIGNELDISPHTVQTHVRHILKKLEVHSKLQAAAFAVKYGAVDV